MFIALSRRAALSAAAVSLASTVLSACAGDKAATSDSAATSGTAASVPALEPSKYLYVWAGDSARKANDFLAVIDASPSSPTYGQFVGATTTGTTGTYPHHTEVSIADNDHLLANGYGAGTSFLYDLSDPRAPKVVTTYGDVAGMNHPHTYTRLPNGNVLATFQYAGASSSSGEHHMHAGAATPPATPKAATTHTTGGLVEMDERGTVVRSGSAVDTTVSDRLIYPYAVLPVPAHDRALSTTTDMDEANIKSTATYIQLWRLSDLKLLRSIALPAGPGGKENQFTGEMKLLADGKSALVHTFMCGLYLVRGLDGDVPTASFVHGFEGKNCGVPVLAGKYFLQTVPDAHAVVSMDVSDPEHPREVSRVVFGDDELPHWLVMEPSGKRLVMNSGGSVSNRVFIVNFDPATGAVAIDEKFRDAGAARAGVRFSARTFPQGFTGTATPHGSVFSRR